MAGATTPKLATLVIPTGYEQMAAKAAAKRKLADELMKQGLAPDNNMTNWAQVLGKWAQTWAGKSMEGDASKMDADVQSQLTGAYNQHLGELSAALADPNADVFAAMEKYGGDPLIANSPQMEALKSAYQKALSGEGRWKPGGTGAEDANRAVILEPDGNGGFTAKANPVWIAAHAAGQGLPTTGYQTSMPWGQKPPGNPGPAVDPQTLLSQARAVGQGGVDPSTIGARKPDGYSNGKPVWKMPDGQFYDNPEGR